MTLIAKGARLYRYTPEERLAEEVAKLPARTEYVKRHMCGYYPTASLGAMNADLLTQTPPISDALRTELRAAYYDGAGTPVLGEWAYLCAEFDIPTTLPPVEPEPELVRAADAPGWDAAAMSLKEFYENGRVKFRAGPGVRAVLGMQALGDPLNIAAPAFNVYCNEFSVYAHARGVPGAPADIFGLLIGGGSPDPSDETTTLTIEKIGRLVNFWISRDDTDGYVFETYAIPDSVPPSVYGLGAAVFTPGGWVEGIGVTGYSGAALALSGVRCIGGAAPAKSGGDLSLPALRTMAGILSGGATSLSALAVRGGRALAEASGVLPAMYVQAGEIGAAGEQFARLRLPALGVSGYSLVGTVGRASLEFRPTAARGGQGSAGAAELTLPSMRMFASALPVGEARMFSHGDVTARLGAAFEVVVVMNTSGQIAAVLGASKVFDSSLETAAGLQAPMVTSSVLSAVMETFGLVSTEEPLRDQIGEVWVTSLLDPDKPATSMFEAYPFNSFGVIGGRPFGVSRDGVYLLEGDDDAGEPIRASVSYGKQDFGTKTEKLMTRAYVGVASDGAMYLKVTANGQEYIYAARGSSAELSQQRFDVGRGLKANYFTFELFNKDGGDFEIDSASFFAADFKRRI